MGVLSTAQRRGPELDQYPENAAEKIFLDEVNPHPSMSLSIVTNFNGMAGHVRGVNQVTFIDKDPAQAV